MKAILGIAVIALTATTPTQAQVESNIEAAEEASSCDRVCNTYTPPQTEEECAKLRNERYQEEYARYNNRTIANQRRRDRVLGLSLDIWLEESNANHQEYNEKVAIAKAQFYAQVASIETTFAVSSLKAASFTGPAFVAAQAAYVATATTFLAAATTNFYLNKEASAEVRELKLVPVQEDRSLWDKLIRDRLRGW